VDFAASKLKPTAAHMRLFIPGTQGREYSSALAPPTKEAPDEYAKSKTPVLIVRQKGEAWNRPFAVIYEPFGGTKKSGSIQSVTALENKTAFAGFKVVSLVAGKQLTQYVLVLPTAESVFQDTKLGIEFKGRYGVISVNEQDRCTSLYLGEGSRLRYQKTEMSSVSGKSIAASAALSGAKPRITSNAPFTLTLADGKKITQ
jgi:hypothetical protein